MSTRPNQEKPKLKFYTGIGSRKTPIEIIAMMREIALALGSQGVILRTGNARGADSAFRTGTKLREVYHPDYYKLGDIRHSYDPGIWAWARGLASELHPGWRNCSESVRDLHTRNVFQIVGYNLEQYSSAVICWTPDGARTDWETSFKTGGTGQAIRIADHYGIKVYNLRTQEDYEFWNDWLNKKHRKKPVHAEYIT